MYYKKRDIKLKQNKNMNPQEEQEDKKKEFSTRDLYLASTLVTLKFRLTGIDIQFEGIKSRGIGYFKFEETPELHEARSGYNQGLIKVEPRIFMTNLQSLKSEVVNIQQNPNPENPRL